MRGSKQLPRNDYLVEVARRGVDLDEPQSRRGGKLWMAIPAPRACRRKGLANDIAAESEQQQDTGLTADEFMSTRAGDMAALNTPAIALDIVVFDRQGALKGRTASTPSHQPAASSFGERNRRT